MTHAHSRMKRSVETHAETASDVLHGGPGVDALPLGDGTSGEGMSSTIFPDVLDFSETHVGPVNAPDQDVALAHAVNAKTNVETVLECFDMFLLTSVTQVCAPISDDGLL